MNIVKMSLQIMLYITSSRCSSPVFFIYVPREIELKDDGSNILDWVRDLRIVLDATQKAYVLNAPLSAPPPLASSVDVVNI